MTTPGAYFDRVCLVNDTVSPRLADTPYRFCLRLQNVYDEPWSVWMQQGEGPYFCVSSSATATIASKSALMPVCPKPIITNGDVVPNFSADEIDAFHATNPFLAALQGVSTPQKCFIDNHTDSQQWDQDEHEVVIYALSPASSTSPLPEQRYIVRFFYYTGLYFNTCIEGNNCSPAFAFASFAQTGDVDVDFIHPGRAPSIYTSVPASCTLKSFKCQPPLICSMANSSDEAGTCTIATCTSDSECNHGTCNATANVCVCDDGWGKSDCSEKKTKQPVSSPISGAKKIKTWIKDHRTIVAAIIVTFIIIIGLIIWLFVHVYARKHGNNGPSKS